MRVAAAPRGSPPVRLASPASTLSAPGPAANTMCVVDNLRVALRAVFRPSPISAPPPFPRAASTGTPPGAPRRRAPVAPMPRSARPFRPRGSGARRVYRNLIYSITRVAQFRGIDGGDVVDMIRWPFRFIGRSRLDTPFVDVLSRLFRLARCAAVLLKVRCESGRPTLRARARRPCSCPSCRTLPHETSCTVLSLRRPSCPCPSF